jgi:hypothetical protein
MSIDERLTEYKGLMNGIVVCRQSHDIKCLCEMVEYIRGQGILYQDFPEKNAALLEELLRISLDLISSPLIKLSDSPWWFIMEVYDIEFHQVYLEKYPPICADLFFKLLVQVLDEKFHNFYKSANMPSYGMCIYFIQMAYGWFTQREQEFLDLYVRMESLISNNPDDLEEPWLKRYKELNASKN